MPKRFPKTLLQAASGGSVSEIKKLLSDGADIESSNSAGWTPLMAAVEGRHQAAARYLLKRGADPNAVASKKLSSARGATPLILAVRSISHEIVSLLLRAGANVNVRTTWSESALYESVRLGDRRLIKMLLRSGAIPRGLDGFTALQNRRWGIVSLLIASGLDPNSRDRWGNTVLGVAVKAGRSDLVTKLIERGADVDQKSSGQVPLQIAAWFGNREMCRRLIEAGANIEATDHSGRTALMDAAYRGHKKIVTHLLDCGDSTRSRNHSGLSASELARVKGHSEIADLLDSANQSRARAKANRQSSRKFISR